jgi:hypothetical protein
VRPCGVCRVSSQCWWWSTNFIPNNQADGGGAANAASCEFAIVSVLSEAFRLVGAIGPDPVFCVEHRGHRKCRVTALTPTRLRGFLHVYLWIEVLSIAYPRIVEFE